MEDSTQPPAWYQELQRAKPEGEKIKIRYGTLDTFCGRFSLSREQALWELDRCRLWRSVKLFNGRVSMLLYEGIPDKIPYQEFDRYAEIIAAEKQNSEEQSSSAHPCLDSTHSFYSEELALAIRAWEYAVSCKPTKSNFTVKIDSFLDKHCVGEKQRERIKSVCNPFKRGPKPT